ILVDPRTKKSYMARRDIVVRNFLDVGGFSTTVIDLPEIPFPEMEFPDMEISDNPIQFDTVNSDNESRPITYGIQRNLFLEQEEEDLNDNEINFNAPDSYEENDNPTKPADTTNASTWIVFWALNSQASVADVSTNKPNLFPKISHCTFQDFSNHPMANKRQSCTLPIAKKLPSLYNRKGFEVNCRKWVDRLVDPGMVTDFYDGRIWKTF
ncbi:9897_t:CDS:2, partial [Gigaspora rosea]